LILKIELNGGYKQGRASRTWAETVGESCSILWNMSWARSYTLEADFVLFDEVNKVISKAMDYPDVTCGSIGRTCRSATIAALERGGTSWSGIHSIPCRCLLRLARPARVWQFLYVMSKSLRKLQHDSLT
jgi:hypothetical protein